MLVRKRACPALVHIIRREFGSTCVKDMPTHLRTLYYMRLRFSYVLYSPHHPRTRKAVCRAFDALMASTQHTAQIPSPLCLAHVRRHFSAPPFHLLPLKQHILDIHSPVVQFTRRALRSLSNCLPCVLHLQAASLYSLSSLSSILLRTFLLFLLTSDADLPLVVPSSIFLC